MAILCAGCAHPVQPTSAPQEQPGTVRVDYNGTLGASTCVPTGPFVCGTFELGTSEETRHQILPGPNRTIDSLNLTLTWEATSSTTEQLKITILAAEPDCNRCFNVAETVEGPSPLLVSFRSAEFEQAVDYLEVVVETSPLIAGTPTYVNTDQSFQVTGTLVETE